MTKLLQLSVVRNIKSLMLMVEVTISPKRACKVNQDYFQQLFSQSTKDVSWAPYEFQYSRIKKVMKPTKDDSILDAGCGSGELTYLFHKDGFNVKGFDSSESSLSKAAMRFGKNLFYQDDLIDMKNLQTKYTKVFLNGVFLVIHPIYYTIVLRNLYAITSENGTVYLFNNPDYSKRNICYSQFRMRARILNVVTHFFPVYKPGQSAFWVKTKNVKKSALAAGFSTFEQLDSWSNHRTHYILHK